MLDQEQATARVDEHVARAVAGLAAATGPSSPAGQEGSGPAGSGTSGFGPSRFEPPPSAGDSGPRLEIASELRTECDDPSDLGPKGRIQVSRRYWVHGPAKDRNREWFDAMHAHWTAGGYRVLEDGRDRAVEDAETGVVTPAPMLWVEADDGFRCNLVSSVRGDLSLVVTSPCIWPDGTPAGSTEAS